VPGSKQTIDDLLWLRDRGIDRVLLEQARTGLITGICGGMQMLGDSVSDPSGIERGGAVAGLGLLPISTTMLPLKVTSIAAGTVVATSLFGQDIPPIHLSGYEIHIGETTYLDIAKPFAQISRGLAPSTPHDDGCISGDGRIFGTYLHGIFDQDSFRHAFINAARAFYRLTPASHLNAWEAMREASINRLAKEVEQALDMEKIFAWAGCVYREPIPATVLRSDSGVPQ
jgi:adenosylcobyric acid synthase